MPTTLKRFQNLKKRAPVKGSWWGLQKDCPVVSDVNDGLENDHCRREFEYAGRKRGTATLV
eukprot:852452-Amphidinium_carterae.1